MHRTSWPALSAAAALVLSAAALVAAPAGAAPAGAAENGDLIVFTRAGDLWLVAPDGKGMRRITNTAAHEDAPSWTPDGNGIRYVRAAQKGVDGEVRQLDLDATGAVVRDSPIITSTLVDDVDWSVDGRVTYTRDLPVRRNQTQQDVFVADVDFDNEQNVFQNPKNVSNHPSHDANPDFSSTGRIAFDSAREGSSSSVWVADDLGATTPTLTRWAWSDPQDGGSFPAWSPDGTQLVYMEYVSPSVNWGLRISDGTDERRLTVGGGNEWDAEFSPDGTEVVFAHSNGSPKEKFHIRRVVVDGGAETIVTQADSVVSRQPSWRPKPAASGEASASPSPTSSPSASPSCALAPLLECP